MNVGILIISHDGIGATLLGAAVSATGGITENIRSMAFYSDSDPRQFSNDTLEQINILDSGDGVLVLTDMHGAIPFNIVNRLTAEANIHVVAGLNLPMLIQVINHKQLALAELSEKAVDAGRKSMSRIMAEQ